MGFTPKHPKDLSAISQIDWARLAAYIDGEGCIRIAGVKGATPFSRRVLYLDITISNTDFRLGVWLQQTFGGNIAVEQNKPKKNAKWAACSRWNVSSKQAAEILVGCLPYFIIKREQAEVALAFQATIITDRRYGRKGRPVELLEQQHALRERLQELKGTSSRARRTAHGATIQ